MLGPWLGGRVGCVRERRLRVGLIGLGAVGRLHLEAYRTAMRIEVVAVAEPDPDRREAARAPEVRLYTNAADMLAQEQLDIACVLTPAASHAAMTLLCATAGVHVLCEKPLAGSLAEATAMIDACQTANVQLAYGASYRFLPAVARAQALIAEGAVGQVVLLREQAIGGAGPTNRQIMPPDHYSPGQPGGSPMGLVDHGVHLIDAFAWMTGARVVSALGRGNVSGRALSPEYLLMTLSNGAVGSLLYDEGTYPTELPAEGLFSWGASWDADGFHSGGLWAASPGTIHVHGTRGALRIAHYANALFLTDKDGQRQLPLEGRPAPHHFAAQIDAFAEDLLAARAPRSNATDGLIALKVLMAAYRANGGFVAI
ncbi:MAG TPA: Gfo/Idh/MocA family oxidoreductase [Caulobacteraceae bacterium]|jgi:predicted dehydrogenase|nr:Gfo/Idh/MocA family oxidoreductase [Caulobacteraceae bacterium]